MTEPIESWPQETAEESHGESMEIHKPKPWHGLREFLKEYLIIFVGVLTALAAEQGVEWLHNGHDLSETREAIREELARNASYAEIGAREDRCQLGVQDRNEQWARGGGAGRETPFLNPFFTTTVWDASQSGAVSRMPLKEKFAYAEFYEQARNLQSMVATQRSQATAIVRYLDLGALDPGEARGLLQEVSGARRTLEYKIWNERRLVQAAVALDAPPRPIPADTQRLLVEECQYAGLAPPDFSRPLSPPPDMTGSRLIAELKKHD